MLSWYGVFLLIATILTAVPAFSLEWHKAYERGRDRIKSGNCSEGQSLLQEALQTNPRDDLKAPTYGTQSMEYFPHYYLALCAFQAGKGTDAARYLKEAESGRIASSKLAGEYQTLKPQIEALQRQQAQQQQTTKPPQQQPEKPPEQKPSVENKTVPPPEKKVEPPVETKRDNSLLIRATLQQATDALNDQRYDDAKDNANRVLMLDPANREARRILDEIASRQAAELQAKDKQQKMKQVQNAIDGGNLEDAERLALALKVQYPSDSKIQNLLKQIQDNRNSQVDVVKQEEIRKSVERDVLIAYYRGEYDQAIRLANLGLPKVPQSWRLHFFLGCAYAALSILEESGTDDRLRLARESFRKARSLSSSTRSRRRNSPAAFRVKVTATTRSTVVRPVRITLTMRRTSSDVFPVPAAASTMSDSLREVRIRSLAC